MEKFDRWQYNMSKEEELQAEEDFKNSGLSEEEYCRKISEDIDAMFTSAQNKGKKDEKSQAFELFGLGDKNG